jgi:hypothetical protein
LLLTSLVKEIGAISQKLIKIDHFVNLDFSWSKNEKNKQWIGIVGDADELRSGDFSRGLGATMQNRKRIVLSRTVINKEKKAVLKSVWLKESY